MAKKSTKQQAKRPLADLQKNITKSMKNGLRRAASRTLEREKQNVGLTDHTLEDLKKLGHPYNQQHPIKIHTSLPGAEWGPVHRQSGKLQDSLTIWQEKANTYTIGLRDWNNPPYALDVINGILPKLAKTTTINGETTTTSRYRGMVPRDFPFATITEIKDQNIIYDVIESAIKEAIKRS